MTDESDDQGSHVRQVGAVDEEKEERAPILLLLAALCLFAGVLVYFGSGVMQIVDDIRLHSSGVVARESACHLFRGRLRSLSSQMSARYTDENGVSYDKGLRLTTLWPPDQSQPCVVRYDPASPGRISTSWGYGSLWSRSLIAGFFLLVGGFGFVVFALLVGLTIRDRARDWRGV